MQMKWLTENSIFDDFMNINNITNIGIGRSVLTVLFHLDVNIILLAILITRLTAVTLLLVILWIIISNKLIVIMIVSTFFIDLFDFVITCLGLFFEEFLFDEE